jgi:integrase
LKIIGQGGLKKIRIYDLRHTFASLLIQAGESFAYIRDQLGHHSINVTVDIYWRREPVKYKDAVDRLDDALIRTPGAPNNKKALIQNGQVLFYCERGRRDSNSRPSA